MAYGRQMVMDNLRKAGTAFLDMDEKYANALEAKLPKEPSNNVILGSIQAIGGLSRAVPVREMNPLTSDNRLVDSAFLAANLASRYALPAGGVTLAGKGLYDLTQGLYASASATPVFGGPEDGAQPGQLPL